MCCVCISKLKSRKPSHTIHVDAHARAITSLCRFEIFVQSLIDCFLIRLLVSGFGCAVQRGISVSDVCWLKAWSCVLPAIHTPGTITRLKA